MADVADRRRADRAQVRGPSDEPHLGPGQADRRPSLAAPVTHRRHEMVAILVESWCVQSCCLVRLFLNRDEQFGRNAGHEHQNRAPRGIRPLPEEKLSHR